MYFSTHNTSLPPILVLRLKCSRYLWWKKKINLSKTNLSSNAQGSPMQRIIHLKLSAVPRLRNLALYESGLTLSMTWCLSLNICKGF